jgi:hypothetical protein
MLFISCFPAFREVGMGMGARGQGTCEKHMIMRVRMRRRRSGGLRGGCG